MKFVLISLALAAGLALAGPAMAADQVATSKPVQLQHAGKQKAKQVKTEAKKAGAKAKSMATAKPQ